MQNHYTIYIETIEEVVRFWKTPKDFSVINQWKQSFSTGFCNEIVIDGMSTIEMVKDKFPDVLFVQR